MHAAAVGEVRAPLLGYVEDVASVRHAFEAQRARADTLNRLCGEQRKRADQAERRAFEAEQALRTLRGVTDTERADQAEAERDELHAALGLAPGQLNSAALSAIRGRGTNVRELTTRAETAEATIERMKRTNRMVNGGARQERERAEKAEKRLDEHRRNLAAILAKSGDTPLDELTEYAARTLTRNGERLLAAEQRAKEAEALAEHYRDTRRRWAEHADGEYAQHRDRADAAEQALAEQKKRADNAWACASKAEATLARISDARQSADVWAALGMHYGWTAEQAGQAARTRRTTDERLAEQRADDAEQRARAADARSDGYVTLLADTAKTADRYRAAYRNAARRARERATHRTAQRDRARKLIAAWTDHAARIAADRDQLRAALDDLAHQEQQ
jgi:hypothetical protein